MKTDLFRLERVYLDTATLGSWYDGSDLVCKTIELPQRDNQRNISCIPEGLYFVTKEPPIAKKDPFGRKYRPYTHFRVHNVPDRGGILVHTANFVSQLRGCIAVGSRHVDINNDNVIDVIESTKKLAWMASNLPDNFYLYITKK